MCEKKSEEIIEVRPHLRQERIKIMSDLDIRHSSMMSMLNSFKGMGDNDIPKEKLRSFPLMKWIEISPGIKVRQRRSLPGDILQFDTTIEKGKEFGLHKHSDCDEICEVQEGELVDLLTNDVYNEGDQAIWTAGVEHTPVAIEYTELKVYFK